MQIKDGIKIYSYLENVSEQLAINGGTVFATEDTGLNYHPGSYIPKKDWRRLNDPELGLLLAGNSNVNYTKRIVVGDIPEELKESLKALKLHECNMPDEVYPKVREQEDLVKAVNDDLHQYLREFSSNRNYKFHRITRAMPDRETITCHYIDEQFIYIGLHIDQSKRFTPNTAYKSGNRISINLSRESRSLAFLNLSLKQFYNMVKKKVDPEKTKIDPDNIAYLFFSNFPDYPTIKINLKPYQYYIAPTDNFFHDATTLGNKAIDVTMVYTGQFDKVI